MNMLTAHQIKLMSSPIADFKEFCARSSHDSTDLKKEISHLHKYLTDNVGEVVDLNLDFLPDFIVATFSQASEAQKVLGGTSMSY